MVYFNRMPKKRGWALLMLVIAGLLWAGNFSFSHADYAPDKIIMILKPGSIEIPRGMRVAGVSAVTVRPASLRALNAKYGVKRVKQLYRALIEARPQKYRHLDNTFVLYLPEGEDLLSAAENYRKDPNVLYVSRVSRVRAFDTNPNDTHFVNGHQYGPVNIKCPQAWDRTTGSSSITIAVLDTGINYNHEDFVGRVDVANGWDFVNNDDNPLDDYGHGTNVSGVIGATTNNGIGVAGVDWAAKILPIKVLDEYGRGDIDDIYEGVAHAILKDADVINMSFGQYSQNTSLESICQDAYDAGIVLVAAAGNGSTESQTYPAAYSTVMAVAAVDQNDKRSVWSGIDPETWRQQASNWGTWVDVAAPGTSIWTTYYLGGYTGNNNGTSLAAPFVAGVAGLVKAVNPGFTNQQIMDKIMDTTDNIDALNPGFEGLLGTGRVNAYQALSGTVAEITSPANNAYVGGRVTVLGAAAGWDFSSYLLEALSGSTVVATLAASAVTVEAIGVLGTWESGSFNGQHSIRLTVFSTGADTEEVEVTVYVDNLTPEAEITFPADGATIEGSVTVLGTAEDQYLDHFVLEYGQGESPLSYEKINESYVSVSNGALGTWETAGLEGIYTLRLTVDDRVGRSVVRTLKVNIKGTSPTKEAEPQPGLPLTYALPNPFDLSATSEVTFNYTLEGNFNVRIYLFDLSGNMIWQDSYLAGENGGKSGANNPAWDGSSLFGDRVSNGVYIYQVVADHKVIAKGKIIILN